VVTGVILPSILIAGGKAGGDEQVRTLLLHHHRQKLVHELQAFIAFHGAILRLFFQHQPRQRL
jgi:hypothetical protein